MTFEDRKTGTVVDVTDADGSIETSGDDAEADAELHSQDGVRVHLNDKIRYSHHNIKNDKIQYLHRDIKQKKEIIKIPA